MHFDLNRHGRRIPGVSCVLEIEVRRLVVVGRGKLGRLCPLLLRDETGRETTMRGAREKGGRKEGREIYLGRTKQVERC